MSGQWWDKSWNPVTGCSPVSEGCASCYAARLASPRLARSRAYEGLTRYGKWTGQIRVNDASLDKGPPKMRGGGVLFCCDMGDLFHEDVPTAVVSNVLQQLEDAGPLVRPFVLTKRPERMREAMARHVRCLPRASIIRCGVTAENEEQARARIPILWETACAERFVSFEPLIGPVWPSSVDALDWAVIGGMTGPAPQECHEQWVDDLVYACVSDGIPVWVKQLGGFVVQRPPLPCERGDGPDRGWPLGTVFGNPTGRLELNGRVVLLKDRRGADMSEWPERLRRREPL
jgi:protein gp37